MDWSLQVIVDYFPNLLEGAWITLKLVIYSGMIGLLLSLPLALMRVSSYAWLKAFPLAYIFFFRGTPLLIQIYLVYYGSAQFSAIRHSFLWPMLREPYWCALITFALHTAAYIAEILRGAIQSIPKGEIEAAKSLGMSYPLMLRRIIMPRAFGIMMPAYGNEVILMLKGSALASTITLLDLTGVARTVGARTLNYMEMFLAAGIIYLVISTLMTFMFHYLERHFNRYQHWPNEHPKDLDPQHFD